MRFDRAAEFLAACASEDTVEASLMLQEARETKRRNGEDVGEIINCANADGITALHQVRPSSLLLEKPQSPVHAEAVLGLQPICASVSRWPSVLCVVEFTIFSKEA